MTCFLNPNTYAHWANCGVGSTVTTEDINEMTMDVGCVRNVVFTTCTLLALDPAKATLEMEIRGAANGAPLEHRETIELLLHPPPEPEKGGDVAAMTFEQLFKGFPPTEADETIEVAGRSLICRRIENAATLHGQEFRLTSWLSAEVPGGLVKSEARMGTGHVTKTTVTAFEKK